MNKKSSKRSTYTQWHPAFYSAIQLDFYKLGFEYHFEYPLNTKPLMIDALIVKNVPDSHGNDENHIKADTGEQQDFCTNGNSDIVSFFKKFNIVEYKSPNDSFNLDVFYKGMGYACILKAENTRLENIDAKDITLTFIRHTCPKKLMKNLAAEGYQIEEIKKGIFHITGRAPFDIQILVTGALDEGVLTWIRVLSKNITLLQYSRIIEKLLFYHNHEDKIVLKLIEAVVEVVNEANIDKIRQWKAGEEDMTGLMKAFYPVFKNEFDAALEEGRQSIWNDGHTAGMSEGWNDGHTAGISEGWNDGHTAGINEGWNDASLQKGLQVFINCKKHGMTDEDAKAIAEITDEQMKMAYEKMSRQQ